MGVRFKKPRRWFVNQSKDICNSKRTVTNVSYRQAGQVECMREVLCPEICFSFTNGLVFVALGKWVRS